ncbi:hypothetical protein GCM10027422_13930 [Hymenobacter arcticus]
MRLLLGKTTSSFESVGNYLADSLESTVVDIPQNAFDGQDYADKFVALPLSRFRFKIFKDRVSNNIYPYESIDTKTYFYQDKFPISSWRITDEKKNVSGYDCQKATIQFGGRIFDAWFTKKIPISDGPYKFYGLPGLIIKVNDIANNYTFQLAKFIKVSRDLSLQLPKKTVYSTKLIVEKGRKGYYANLVNMVSTLTHNGLPLSPEERKMEYERIRRKYNNSLELLK